MNACLREPFDELARCPRAARWIPTLMVVLAVLVSAAPVAQAQPFKELPPRGDAIDRQQRSALQRRVDGLQKAIERAVGESDDAGQWRADVEVLVRAVRLALEQDLFFQENDVRRASELLDLAESRLADVRAGRRGLRLLGLSDETLDEPQLLVGGFQSRIDDSMQPYGLVIPAGHAPDDRSPKRMDVWLHGRGDRKTEVQFLSERLSKPGLYTPADTVVLHPFGRHCNAFKFAGETDVYEAMACVRDLLPVDDRRVAIRGFSMGGAGCWHLAVHDPAAWFAANPGAGFVDTLVYQGWGDSPPFELDDVQRRLLRWYDVLPWATNLKNTRVIAYSGEVDKQKQAADRVFDQSKKQGFTWDYVIGPKMGHKVDPASAATIDGRLDEWSQEQSPGVRRQIDFVTYSLRYADAEWLHVTGLHQHWQPGHVRARVVADRGLAIDTEGVTHLTLDFEQSGWPGDSGDVMVTIDGETWNVSDVNRDRPGLQCNLVKQDRWSVDESADAKGEPAIRKRPGMQGPIDDAFTERFLFVVPSGRIANDRVQRWVDDELQYAKTRWRDIMRGNARVVSDKDVTKKQVEECNLICFGDFQSNRYLAKVASELPIEWKDDVLRVGATEFVADRHAPVFCYPNPENPDRYLVVNSGMTFREFSNNSNSRQIAMLPDWAVIDVGQSGNGIYPGGVAAKGFFDEAWRLRDSRRDANGDRTN